MARRPREDGPDSWHHVINRGIAKRPLFEDEHDVRYFLSRLAREVRRGRLELHAWSILTTHFHLLVRSPRGELSEALRRAQNEYSRHFNRRHRRDGSLFRGRFLSRPVHSRAYRWSLVRYIDANPVRAGIVGRSLEYPFGSAFHFARLKGPPWATRDWIEREVVEWSQFLERVSDVPDRERSNITAYQPQKYELAFPALRDGHEQRWVERRIVTGSGPDPLDRLVASAPERVLRWMRRKARVADGTKLGQPILDADSIHLALDRERLDPVSSQGNPCSCLDQWSALESGLLRDLACLSWTEIAASTGSPRSTCWNKYQLHAKLMGVDSSYANRAAEITARMLSEFHAGMTAMRVRYREYGVAPP
jgi:REP element-mobilizing transposase RayT